MLKNFIFMQNNQKSQNIGLKFEFHTQDIVISESLTDTKNTFFKEGFKND